MRKRRTTGDKDAPSRFAFPGANFPGLGRGRDTPLSAKGKLLYILVVSILVLAIVVAVVWTRATS